MSGHRRVVRHLALIRVVTAVVSRDDVASGAVVIVNVTDVPVIVAAEVGAAVVVVDVTDIIAAVVTRVAIMTTGVAGVALRTVVSDQPQEIDCRDAYSEHRRGNVDR